MLLTITNVAVAFESKLGAMNQLIAEPAQPTLALKALMKEEKQRFDKHEGITLPMVSPVIVSLILLITSKNSLIAVTLLSINLYAHR